ncbi:MAG: hypothetical protein GY817_03630, partial [bacterium]|nr:hypothetical protein [bacterium]
MGLLDACPTNTTSQQTVGIIGRCLSDQRDISSNKLGLLDACPTNTTSAAKTVGI